jgi:hypothetical protein
MHASSKTAASSSQQLDSRLSSRRRSRALSLGRWGGVGGTGGGDAAAGNAPSGDDGDAGNGVAAAEPRAALPVLNEYAAAKASCVGSKVSEVGFALFSAL